VGWLGPVVVLAVVAVLAVLTTRSNGDDPARMDGSQVAGTAGANTGTTNPFAALARRQEGDPLARGRVDAPVVIVEYSDFQCPFCRRFAQQTAPRLLKKYVDPGLVRFEWRDLPYLGTESRTTAAAARAAGAQGRFWEFHDAVYATERRVNSGALDDAALRAVAQRIGLDLARFDADRTARTTLEAIDRDQREATSLGITGTPAFLVGGTPVIGAQPYEEFKRVIDRELAGR